MQISNGEAGSSVRAKLNVKLAEWVNVKDPAYGATGDGSTDDTAAITAAIVACSGGGIVFFPAGTYKVTSTVDIVSIFSTSLTLMGVSQKYSIITGSVSGPIFENTNTNNSYPGALIMENLGVRNTHSTAGVGVHLETGTTPDIRNCDLQALICIAFGSTDSVNDQTPGGRIASCHFSSPSASWRAGSMAIYSAALDVTISNCSALGFDQAFRICGTGHLIEECQLESNNYGVMVGRNYANSAYRATGVKISGGSLENNFHASIYIEEAVYVTIDNPIITFGDNVVGRESETGITVNGVQKLTVSTVTTNGAWTIAGVNILNVDNVSKVLFINSDCSSFNIAAGTKKSNLTQINCTNFPSFATTATLLPGNAGNASEPPSFNDRRFITDGSATTYAPATTESGGGANLIPVTYNGANWVRA